ncbi:MAG: GNAT family N-acetyltransferase [Dehalococcoidia bacterium]
MPDMLVRLYDLPPAAPEVARLAQAGIVCRRAESFQRSQVVPWVAERWPGWRDEVASSFAAMPPTCAIATREATVLGFACWNATRPDYFGPTGVDEAERGAGIGKALLLLALEALANEGYAYAIIGGVGPAKFYEAAVGAFVIPGSETGIYGAGLGGEQ